MRLCCINNCCSKHFAKGYCSKHYLRYLKHGDPLFSKYNREGNKFEHLDNNITKIYLNHNQETIIDTEDFNRVKHYIWRADYNKNTKSYYAINFTSLSRFIMKTPPNLVCNHINSNSLDNRKINLQNTTKQQCLFCRKTASNNKSGITGVSWSIKNNKWFAHIQYNYEKIYIGLFDNFEDAVKARKDKERELFGI